MTSFSSFCAARRPKSVPVILAASLLAAAVLIVGPDFLAQFTLTRSWPKKIIDLVTFVPAMIILLWTIRPCRKFMAREYRSWDKILGRKQ